MASTPDRSGRGSDGLPCLPRPMGAQRARAGQEAVTVLSAVDVKECGRLPLPPFFPQAGPGGILRAGSTPDISPANRSDGTGPPMKRPPFRLGGVSASLLFLAG